MKKPAELAALIRANSMLPTADRQAIATYLECLVAIHSALNEQGQWDSDTPEITAQLLAAAGLPMDEDPGLMPGEDDSCSVCGQPVEDEENLFCNDCVEKEACQ